MSIANPVDREVFILGAGFTKGFNPATPVTAGFLKDSQGLLARDEFRPVVEFCGRCRMDAPKLNIETLLTLASIRKPWQSSLDAATDALAAEAIVALIEQVLRASFTYDTHHNTWQIKLDPDRKKTLYAFASFLLTNARSHVITFNYDPLLEQFLELAATSIRHVPGEKARFGIEYSYGFHGATADIGPERIEQARGPFPPGGMFFLKMHGSMMWVSRIRGGAPATQEDILCFRCLGINPRLEYYDAMYETRAFIVPPILDKTTLLQNPVIDVIWGQAAKLLPTAHEIVFLGYSMPPTDYYSEFLFRRYTRPDALVTVVDLVDSTLPAAEEKKVAIKERYRAVFPRMLDDDFHFDGVVAYCQQFVTRNPSPSFGAELL